MGAEAMIAAPSTPRSVRPLLLVLLALCATWTSAGAQAAPHGADPRRPYATRASLESLIVSAEGRADAESLPPSLRQDDAAVLRERLANGDFRAGDRIVVVVTGEAALSDTFTVTPDQTLELPQLEPLPLRGVLRAELHDHLRAHLSRYLRDPQVRATPLIRLAAFGRIGSPGFYAVSADLLLSDFIMLAGGPGGDAELRRSSIRRGDETVVRGKELAAAITYGLTLDQLHVRSGDELLVVEQRKSSWGTVLQGASIAVGLISLIFGLRR